MSLLGVDIGTSGCKAALFSENGEMIALSYNEYPTLHTGTGQVELDAPLVYQKVKDTIVDVMARVKCMNRSDLGRISEVKAMCIGSMGEAVVPVNFDRTILGNSILSSDVRGGEYVERAVSLFGKEQLYAINPNIPGVNYTMPKLCWTRDNERCLYDDADLFLLWGDLIGFLFGGEPASSFSLANRTLLFDINSAQWSDSLIEGTNLDKSKLPPVYPSGHIVGQLSSSIADELGLPRGVVIVTGGHDQGCNALGAGVVDDGQAVCGMGTYECITPVYSFWSPSDMLQANLNVEHHVIPNKFVSFIYNQSGSLMRWFRDVFASFDKMQSGTLDIYDRLAQEMPMEPTSSFILPYFEMTGAPEFHDGGRGAILGLTLDADRGTILKAIMEGTTYYFADNLKRLANLGLAIDELIVTGGGSKSDRWLQIKADILGLPVSKPSVTEAGVFGAALLAGSAVGIYDDPAQAAKSFVRMTRTFEPDTSRHQIYRENLGRYQELRRLLIG